MPTVDIVVHIAAYGSVLFFIWAIYMIIVEYINEFKNKRGV